MEQQEQEILRQLVHHKEIQEVLEEDQVLLYLTNLEVEVEEHLQQVLL
jgi:hypothetical protein